MTVLTSNNEEALQRAKAITPEWGQEHILAAFNGDADAALSLCVSLSDHRRAEMVALMYGACVSPGAFREMLTGALDQTHHYKNVLETAGGREGLNRWFCYASYKLPEALAEEVTIYRGTYDCYVDDTLQGLSWTIDFGVAAWFACRGGPSTEALVVEAVVRRPDLLFYSDGRMEQEVIPAQPPTCMGMWDNYDDLMLEANRWMARK